VVKFKFKSNISGIFSRNKSVQSENTSLSAANSGCCDSKLERLAAVGRPISSIEE